MAMNLTKLANAEYTLHDIMEALDADGATVGTGPSGYYTAKGNPPGRWIGSAPNSWEAPSDGRHRRKRSAASSTTAVTRQREGSWAT